ncbi:MAG TPA: thiazole synthase, partial [Planctomycetaceae bacterium]|nr:thiazole synthase [Planctomycetaceae bacterium]
MSVSETPGFSNPSADSTQAAPILDTPLVLGTHELKGRLVVGTGKYANYELMRECLEASGAEVITVAIRRERLIDDDGRNILDFIDL